jgi:hypothetical protein
MNSKPNDCSVCAVINALLSIGITVDREEIEIATKYNHSGGFADVGLHIIADRLGLQGEYYPKGSDIIWVNDPTREQVRIAPPELHKDKFFQEYKNRLENGWVAVTTHRWEDTENFHAVALIGVENEKIKVCCSLKEIYLVDQGFLVSKKGQLNGLLTTYWVKK